VKVVLGIFWINVGLNSLGAMVQEIHKRYDASLCSWVGAVFWLLLIAVVQQLNKGAAR